MPILINSPGGIWAAKPPMVFSPYVSMESQVRAAASQLGSYFDDIDSSLDRGDEIPQAVSAEKIAPVVRRLAASARLMGYQHGAAVLKKRMPALYGHKVRVAAEARGYNIDKIMRRTTRKTLRRVPDSQYVLSGGRAMAAAKYEAARGYFRGMADALAGSGLGKRWRTAGGESCDDCLANEADGVIGVDEAFASGDFYPALHLNCMCIVSLAR